jgi:hypothetical protein
MISEATQKIGRPRQLYTGPTERQVAPLRHRAPSYDISFLGSTKSASKLALCSPHSSTKSLDFDDLVFYKEGGEGGDDFEITDGNNTSGSGASASASPQKARFYRPN